jgi:GT2 family glycosyltransferase
MSNHAAPPLLVDPIPYGIDDLPGRTADPQRDGDARPQHLLDQIEKVNAFARDWKEKNRGQSFEADSLAGGCVLLKREVLQKLGLSPTRTPLGIFDTEALGLRVRQTGYRLAACRELFIHNFGSRGLVRR